MRIAKKCQQRTNQLVQCGLALPWLRARTSGQRSRGGAPTRRMNGAWRLSVISALAAPLLLAAGLPAAFAALPARNECNPRWLTQLETDPGTPAPYFNNVDTGYAEAHFLQGPGARIRLELTGSFPPVRFISFQTYTSRHFAIVSPDGILSDSEITMDAGSVNPFVAGAPTDPLLAHDYTIQILPHEAPTGPWLNVLRMGPGDDPLQELTVRFYSPDDQVDLTQSTQHPLPRVHAYFLDSGRPAPCPIFIPVPPLPSKTYTCAQVGGPTIAFDLITPASNVPHYNAAIPAYLVSCNSMTLGQVAVVRFKAPTFVNTHWVTATGQPQSFPDPDTLDVRYWSIGAQDPTNTTTFGGVADWSARVDAGGNVTLVVSNDADVQQLAGQLQQNFLLDTRQPTADPTHEQILFIYRNLLPLPAFWNGTDPYPADYAPTGQICDASVYLASGGNCPAP
jgi:catechol 2,3-dioxygenase-like lactoylglutathione lyase family enzyme